MEPSGVVGEVGDRKPLEGTPCIPLTESPQVAPVRLNSIVR